MRELYYEQLEDGSYIVENRSIAAYGTGESFEEAVGDLRNMAHKMYDDLMEPGYELSEPLAQRLRGLRKYLGK